MDKRYPHELSGGQQQRVAIARSLVCRPKLMLLDEPFSNIDSQLRIPLIREIRDLLKSQHITAIFVTHNKEEAFSLADELAVFQQGNIVQQGEASAVYHQPANLYVAEFLGKGNRVPVTRQSDQSVLTPWGVIPVNQVPDHPDLMMFIRPQWLEIVEGGDGRLIEQHFLGTHAHCRIHWQGMELDAWHADSMPISTTAVSLRLRPHKPVIFRCEQG
jgi:iron(III) transport system ATP-binding protein